MKKLEYIHIENKDIISLIRKLNPNKANGPDGIPSQMLLFCDDSVIVPLRIIFNNILSTAIYPDVWKLANVTPIFKKGDKQLIKNYRPISLLPICGKMFEKKSFLTIFIIILLLTISSQKINLDFDLVILLQTN